MGPFAAFGCALRALALAQRQWSAGGHCGAFAASGHADDDGRDGRQRAHAAEVESHLVEERGVFGFCSLPAAGDRQEVEIAQAAGRAIFRQDHLDREQSSPFGKCAARLAKKAKRVGIVPIVQHTRKRYHVAFDTPGGEQIRGPERDAVFVPIAGCSFYDLGAVENQDSQAWVSLHEESGKRTQPAARVNEPLVGLEGPSTAGTCP